MKLFRITETLSVNEALIFSVKKIGDETEINLTNGTCFRIKESYERVLETLEVKRSERSKA